MSRLSWPGLQPSPSLSSGRNDASSTRRTSINARSRNSSSRAASPLNPARSGSSEQARPSAQKWRPSAAGVAFVRQVSMEGQSLSIRRAQDVASGKYSLGMRPIPKKSNRNRRSALQLAERRRDSSELWITDRSTPQTAAAANATGFRFGGSPTPAFRNLSEVGSVPLVANRAHRASSEATVVLDSQSVQSGRSSHLLWMIQPSHQSSKSVGKPSSISSDGSCPSSGVVVIDPLHLRRGLEKKNLN